MPHSPSPPVSPSARLLSRPVPSAGSRFVYFSDPCSLVILALSSTFDLPLRVPSSIYKKGLLFHDLKLIKTKQTFNWPFLFSLWLLFPPILVSFLESRTNHQSSLPHNCDLCLSSCLSAVIGAAGLKTSQSSSCWTFCSNWHFHALPLSWDIFLSRLRAYHSLLGVLWPLLLLSFFHWLLFLPLFLKRCFSVGLCPALFFIWPVPLARSTLLPSQPHPHGSLLSFNTQLWVPS